MNFIQSFFHAIFLAFLALHLQASEQEPVDSADSEQVFNRMTTTGGSFSQGRGNFGGGFGQGRGGFGGGFGGGRGFGPGGRGFGGGFSQPGFGPGQMAAGGMDDDGIDYGADADRRRRLSQPFGPSPSIWNPFSWPDFFRRRPPQQPVQPPQPAQPQPSPSPSGPMPTNPSGGHGGPTGSAG